MYRNQGDFSFKYLKPGDLRRLEHLLFAPRRVVEGRYAGHFVTRQRGQSVEFRDYREYLPGDDIGHVDWKVYGRTDKLFIKIFEHHSELTVHLLVDGSASMAYRGSTPADRKGPSKFDYSCLMSAAIAFLIMKQHDHFGFAFARNGLRQQAPPQGTMQHLMGILRQMERYRVGGRSGLADAIHTMNRQGARRNLLIVFSDLWDEADEVAKATAARLSSGGEIILFHVLHPDEINLPDIEHGLFIDSESDARVRLNIDDVREEYQARAREFLETWSRRCKGMGADYIRLMTNQPYQRVLEHYLAGRAAMKTA
jgi:uncharacterized protein (DUF58 family)